MGGLRPLYWFYIKLSPTHFTIKLRPYKLHGSYPRVNIHWRHRVENFSTVQDFWTTCTCPENFTCFEIFLSFSIFEQFELALKINSCPENFHCIALKCFISFRNFEQLALVPKTEFALKFLTVLKYFLSFRIFEQLALALKSFKPGRCPRFVRLCVFLPGFSRYNGVGRLQNALYFLHYEQNVTTTVAKMRFVRSHMQVGLHHDNLHNMLSADRDI